MICPSCGSQLPDGTDFCPNCGSVIPADMANEASAKPAFNVNDAIFNGSSNNTYSTPTVPAKSSSIGSSGTIVGIIIAVIIIAMLGIYLGMNAKYMGTYKFDSIVYTYDGQEYKYTATDAGMTGDEFKLSVGLFNRITVIEEGNKATGKVKFNGDTVEISDSQGTIKGKYDKNEKTISISLSELMEYASSSDLSASDRQILMMYDDIVIIFKK
ncbi:MAG: zinc ribbon domain-containing protein [Lachnospiraceae bacterium]|nr:zinc ribbon domain-containing protein [Lachnospiraceae bacterium]